MSNPAYLSAADFSRATGLPINAVKRGLSRYVARTQDYQGMGLPAPKRGEIPCLVAGSPRANVRVIPAWVAKRMGELA